MHTLLTLTILLIAGLSDLFAAERRPLSGPNHPRYCHTCERTPDGRIKRSRAAVNEFKRRFPCPVTGLSTGKCEGWRVDHIIPLSDSGPDTPENMQWLTEAEHKRKSTRESDEDWDRWRKAHARKRERQRATR